MQQNCFIECLLLLLVTLQVHNISDILGGFLLAIIFTTPFAIKAIGLHTCVKRLIDGPRPADEAAPAKTSGPILPVTMQDSAAVQHGPGPSGIGNGA